MPTPVTMPVLGLTMEEGTVAAWLKQVGERVEKDEPLLSVEMDKGVVEVPSPMSGTLARIVVPVGQTVPVKTLIAEIAGAGEPVAVPGETPAGEAGAGERQASGAMTVSVSAPLSAQTAGHAGRRFASPRARMRARELGVDVGSLAGSGPNGRIVEDDVLATARVQEGTGEQGVRATPLARRLALEHGVSIADVRGTGPGGRVTQEDVLAVAVRRSGTKKEAEAGVAPLSRVRRLTAERMAESAHSVARVTLFLEADFTEAARFRQQLQPEFARLGVEHLPWDALIAKAAGLALAEHPALNREWVEGQGLRQHERVHVGVAVALEPEGLVVPVLRDADRRSPRDLAGDLAGLVERARGNQLRPEEMQGGSFTITNLGSYRVDGFTPILNPPQAAILGVGRIAEKPAVVAGQLTVRTLCTLSLAFDHRVADGAPAAAFLARLAELLERPYALLGI